jgi:hypothetical protein
LKPARIDHNAILFDKPPDAGHLGHACGLGKVKAEIPILDGAELGQALLRSLDYVLIDPANASGVRS